MTSCNHHPIFKIKLLFARSPKYICKNCGAEIEMTTQTKTFTKIINAVTIGGLVYLALKGDFSKSQVNSMVLYFTVMGGIVAAYLLLQSLVINLGKFQEIEPDEVITAPSPEPDLYAGTESGTDYGTFPETETGDEPADMSGTAAGDVSATDADTSKPQYTPEQLAKYTPEQLDLMALYESYAKLDRDENEANAPAAVKVTPAPEVDDCIHVPAKNWKNYVPGVYDFKCENCGKTITFSVGQKRRLNLILLGFSSVILVVSFSQTAMPFWGLILLALGVVAVCSVVQYYFVKTSVFETKENPV